MNRLLRAAMTLIVLAWLPSRALADDGDLASKYGAFAFSDTSGTRVLALGTLEHPEQIHVLITPAGYQLPVTYEATQPQSPKDTGRQLSYNFDRTEGQRFRIDNGFLEPNAVGFLAGKALLSIGTPKVPVPSKPQDWVSAEHRAIERQVGREVIHYWDLASDDKGIVRLYQFAPKDTSFLASLVLEDRNKKPIRLDFESNGSAEPDVWREGDGGEISGESFKILFILRGRNETFLAYSWAAEEGEDLALLRCPAGKSVFDLPVFAYRYWVPY